MDDLIGRQVSHYSIVREIGRGGVGVVYEAEDERLGRRVAIKFLSGPFAPDSQTLERFQREARAASALNHPGICTVYAIESHEGRPCIVMELVEGLSLADLAHEAPLDAGRVADYGLQIAEALEAAHERGIVHRDLKPANLIVGERGRIKVLDFGLAKVEPVRRERSGSGSGGSGPRPAAETISGATPASGSSELTVAGAVLGTVSYMSPEQARGEVADARSDLFSLGAVLYQLATGSTPFPGETQATVFVGLLTRDPVPATQLNPLLPFELGRILGKALEKERALRYQSAADFQADLARLVLDLDPSRRRAELLDSRERAPQPAKSVAVLYFENLSSAKEDEYLRDGITEDLLTELSKIRGLNVFSRPTVLAYRDRRVTPAEVGQQIGATHVLAGSVRRSDSRMRINAQLIDTRTDFPLWSERYDRETRDVFEVQDEIARKIAEALRITLTPQEEAALATRPTSSPEAYDLYLRGKSFSRRLTRQDLEMALQLFETAVALDPTFALGHASVANVWARYHYIYARDAVSLEKARAASGRAVALEPDLLEARVAQGWILYAGAQYDDAVRIAREVVARQADCEGAYYLMLRALFGSGRYRDVVEIAEKAIVASSGDYNVFVPIGNALGALGLGEDLRAMRLRRIAALEKHLKLVPEDVRARILVGGDYASEGRVEDAMRETNLAMTLRPDESVVLYNAACTFCVLGRKGEAMDALARAWRAGFKDADWVRRDPDLELLRGEPEFERLYPARGGGAPATG